MYIHKPLRITKGNNSHRNGPSSLLFIMIICLVDMNVYARFDEIPSITLKDTKKTKMLRTDGRTDVLTNGIYEAMFSYFGYLCGYFPLRGLDTQQKTIATKISNLRNKSHLDTKVNTSVFNCPNL